MMFGQFVPMLSDLAWSFAEKSISRKKQNIRKSAENAKFITSPNELRDYAKKIYDDVREFVHEEIIPIEQIFIKHEAGPDKWTQVIPYSSKIKSSLKSLFETTNTNFWHQKICDFYKKKSIFSSKKGGFLPTSLTKFRILIYHFLYQLLFSSDLEKKIRKN